jgi:hypothetical protein
MYRPRWSGLLSGVTLMRLVVAGVLTAALAGCGGGSEPEAATPSPTPTVSVQTSCDRLFVQGHPRLWFHASDLVAKQSQGQTVDAAEVETVYDELAKIAGSSAPELRPHIETMAETVGDLENADTSAYKTAATEVANQCTAYVALG